MQSKQSYNEFRQRGTIDFPIELHHLDHLHPRYQMSYHWHHECEIIRVLEGEFTLSLDQRTLSLKAGDVAFINSGAVHGGMAGNCVYECIVFNMQMLLTKNFDWLKPLQKIGEHELLIEPLLPHSDSVLQKNIRELFEALSHKQTAYQLSTIGSLYQIFGRIIEKGYYTSLPSGELGKYKRTAQIKRVLSLIESSYHEALTLEQLSAQAGMSPKYFCQFFQEITKRTPIDYLNYYRIEQAAYQMMRSDSSVTEIAYSCGFNDLSYFIRAFKKYKGTTPGRYQRQFRTETRG